MLKEISGKTLVPIELGDIIFEEFEKQIDKGVPAREAVRRGIEIAMKKWRYKSVDKSWG